MNAPPSPDQDYDLVAQAIASEQALIGALLMAPASYLSTGALVQEGYFVEPFHLKIYRAIADSHGAGRAGGIGDIRQALGADLTVPVEGGLNLGAYLARMMREVTTLNAADYARAMRDLWCLRQARALVEALDTGLPEHRVKGLFDSIDSLRVSVEERSASRASIGEIGLTVATQAARISAGLDKEPGITTGLAALDDAMLGWRPGELVIVAARPGMGKSTFATSLALASADTTRSERIGGVGFFCFELGADAVGARCLADLAADGRHGPTHSAVRQGRLTLDQVQALEAATLRLKERAVMIDSRSKATVGEIEAACISMRRTFERQGRRLDVVFIDYLKQIEASDRYRGNRVYEVGEITHGLRDMAKRMQLTVVLLAQLNRGVEGRDDKRPTLADLRESGDLENDADVVIFLYRPAYYLQRQIKAEKDAEKQAELYSQLAQVEHDLEFILAKNRNGAGEQTVRAWCDIGRSAVRSLDWRH